MILVTGIGSERLVLVLVATLWICQIVQQTILPASPSNEMEGTWWTPVLSFYAKLWKLWMRSTTRLEISSHQTCSDLHGICEVSIQEVQRKVHHWAKWPFSANSSQYELSQAFIRWNGHCCWSQNLGTRYILLLLVPELEDSSDVDGC